MDNHEIARALYWTEPTFKTDSHLKQVYKSRLPGQKFGAGVHQIVYIATDADGLSSKCNFKIIVRSKYNNINLSVGSLTKNIHNPHTDFGFTGRRRVANEDTFVSTGRLENHDSYLMCPGKKPIKMETNYPVSTQIRIVLHNYRHHPNSHYQHHHRHPKEYQNNMNNNNKTHNDHNGNNTIIINTKNNHQTNQINRNDHQHHHIINKHNNHQQQHKNQQQTHRHRHQAQHKCHDNSINNNDNEKIEHIIDIYHWFYRY